MISKSRIGWPKFHDNFEHFILCTAAGWMYHLLRDVDFSSKQDRSLLGSAQNNFLCGTVPLTAFICNKLIIWSYSSCDTYKCPGIVIYIFFLLCILVFQECNFYSIFFDASHIICYYDDYRRASHQISANHFHSLK